MLFSSLEFIFRFLPLFFLCYFVVPKRGRNMVLFLGSLIFYALGEPFYILLMLCSILVNYGAARGMMAARGSAGRRLCLMAALVFDLGALFVFKYFDFFAGNVNAFVGRDLILTSVEICRAIQGNINALIGRDLVPPFELTLPIGISFYMFQMISYVVDLYVGTIQSPGTFLEFGTYVSMFPQLIAGPIVQYREVSAQLKERPFTARQIEQGLELFCLGLGSKVLLANKISIFWNQVQGIGFSSISTPIAWMGAVAFSFNIYFDFWGYSLMAMGLGRMMGFSIPRNFSVPYMAHSATEFWRRWHITLGRFFREYVYIPLGGNRKGKFRTIFNLFLVWSFTGLWHGASWNFVVWGLGFFVLLVLEKNFYGSFLERHELLGHLYVWLFVPVSWMVFEITDFSELIIYLKQMVGIHAGEVMVGTEQLMRYLQEYGWLFALCALCATWFPVRVYRKLQQTWWLVMICLVIFWLCVYELYRGAANPFLYFRF